MPNWFKLVAVTLACALMAPCVAGPSMSFILQGQESASDNRLTYEREVLQTALEKTRTQYGPFSIVVVGEQMNTARLMGEIMHPGGRINILTRATSGELEKKLLPIRFPIDRGIVGWRLLLVKREQLPRFASVAHAADLRKFSFGQGSEWVDTEILGAAGFKVHKSAGYEALFLMLAAGRFDAFPRAVDEAIREVDERGLAEGGIEIEPALLLHYPLPRYFFVRRDAGGARMARRVAAGLETMLRDGSLLALFRKHKGPLIEKARLHTRRVITLPNPTLTPETPLARSELWFDPAREK
ncbi:MAG: hypothetical protein V4857_16805 [Pseudomonadota bacterium]